jgi:GNAT superfamily N-acetyltransferase/predicted nucleic acid-binding protein
MEVNVLEVQPNSLEYLAVVALADKYRSSLGFLPRQAYEDYAKSGTILAAQLAESTIAGYLLYRETPRYSRISVVHLCVDAPYRGLGVAKKLFEYLRRAAAEWPEITLLCRRDYQLNEFWERLGFQYSGEKKGRGRKQAILSEYRYHLQHDLFGLSRGSAITGASNKIKAVIDANVFYQMETDDGQHPLQADWLLDDVDLFVTPELTGEINRSSDSKQRLRNLDFVRTFPYISEAQTDREGQEQIYQLLKARLASHNPRPQDESDLRHLTYSIVGKADFFITKDGLLREKLGEDVRRHYGVTILRPEELIIKIDEYVNHADYRSDSLAGSSIEVHQIRSDEISVMIRHFHRIAGEKQSHFRDRLSVFLNQPLRYQAMVITGQENELWGLLIVERSSPHRLDIPIFLLVDPSRMAALASHLLTWLTEVAVSEDRNLVCLQSAYTKLEADALENAGFHYCDHNWCKACGKGVFTIEQLGDFVLNLRERHPAQAQLLDEIAKKLAQASNTKDVKLVLDAERLLWPLKISEVEVPCYIVPIRPRWAMDLFDTNLGKGTLFGSDTSLAFRMDNVYYRSAVQNLPTAPARILWYVSQDPHRRHDGLSAVRACAYVDEVQTGSPKEIFGRFRKLGVYSWVDLMRSTEGRHTERVLAFQFGMTELLKQPVSLALLKEILGRKSAPQAPIKITADQFLDIYKLGQ